MSLSVIVNKSFDSYYINYDADHPYMEEIPNAIKNLYGERKGTIMPGSPLCNGYKTELTHGGISMYGQRSIVANVTMEWVNDIHHIWDSRKLRHIPEVVEAYHSRFAISCKDLLLNELEKHRRDFIAGYQEFKPMISWCQSALSIFHEEILLLIKDSLTFNRNHIIQYVHEHKGKTIIPRGISGQRYRWDELSWDQMRELYELDKYTLECILEKGVRTDLPMALESQYVGHGIRARSAPINGLSNKYTFLFDRSREVTFTPMLSSWFAFVTYSDQKDIYKILHSAAENLLPGIEIVLPPELGGRAWIIMDDPSLDAICYDGKTWEVLSGQMTNAWYGRIWNGYPKLASGIALTYAISTLASIGRLAYAIRNGEITGRITCVMIHGDDVTILGSGLKFNPKDGSIEKDEIASRYRCFLGWMLLLDNSGRYTWPGLYRATVDRASKAKSWNMEVSKFSDENYSSWGPSLLDSVTIHMDKPKYEQRSRDLYYEVMAYGTIDQLPMREILAKMDSDTFRKWVMADTPTRLVLLSEISQM
jgi:hypothetical protein